MPNLNRKRPVFSLLLLMLALLLSFPASAAEQLDLSKTSDLTIAAPYDDAPVKGVEFRLYRVATMSSRLTFTLTENFKASNVDVNDLNNWVNLGKTTFPGFLTQQSDAGQTVAPDYTAKTNASGEAVFTELPVGLYLVTGESYESGDYTYTPTSYLITLPQQQGNFWSYDVKITAKAEREETPTPPPPPPPPGGEEYTLVSVLKIWDDSDYEKRPTEVAVSLYKDGKLYDTVTLNKENNWKHTWTKLLFGPEWLVVEDEVPEGYTVVVEQQGTRFVVTNTRPPDPPPPPPPPPEDPPPTDIPDDDTPLDNLPDDDPPLDNLPDDDVPLDTLPKTGMLWWPVPVLLSAGLFLILLGCIRRRGSRYED